MSTARATYQTAAKQLLRTTLLESALKPVRELFRGELGLVFQDDVNLFFGHRGRFLVLHRPDCPGIGLGVRVLTRNTQCATGRGLTGKRA